MSAIDEVRSFPRIEFEIIDVRVSTQSECGIPIERAAEINPQVRW